MKFDLLFWLQLTLIVSVSLFPSELYVVFMSAFILVLLFQNGFKIRKVSGANRSIMFFVIFCGSSAYIVAVFKDIYAIRGIIYLVPFLAYILFPEAKNKFDIKKVRMLLAVLYLIALTSGLHAFFFSSTYDGLGRVSLPFLQIRRNSLYSDVESTALALGIISIYLCQLDNRIFVFGRLIDYFLSLFIVITTVSKSVLLFYPFVFFLAFDYSKFSHFIIAISGSLLLVIGSIYLIEPLLNYYQDNGASSFSGRIEKWKFLFSEKETFSDFFLGNGLRYVNLNGPFAGPHSYFVGIFLELGFLAPFASMFLLAGIFQIYRNILISLVAVMFFSLTLIASEVIFNRYFVLCMLICTYIASISKLKKSHEKINSHNQ